MDQLTVPVRDRANIRIAVACLAFFAGMIGMAYASVPLYKLFCQVTGYGGTTQRVEQVSDTILDRTIDVRFDANTSALPWDFSPVQREISPRIGETVEVLYRATNRTDKVTRGRATFNVTPQSAGAFFNKVQCFCFTDTTLQPGETIEMPVVFYVDPDIVNTLETRNVKTITLSYTFFPIDDPVGDKPQASLATTNENGSGNRL
jgi:cytochrome c oxidase assembly protein subunit 11